MESLKLIPSNPTEGGKEMAWLVYHLLYGSTEQQAEFKELIEALEHYAYRVEKIGERK